MSHQPQVLLVEDEPLSRDVLTRRLQAQGYQMHAVNDGIECLEWLASNRCDLVLMDMSMPRMNGIDCIRQIRRSFSHDSLPVIIVSAMVDSDDVVAGLEAGANDYVVKPVNFRVLRARMHTCLRIKHTVTVLVEAERQRVMIETLSRSAQRLGAPLNQVIDNLERVMQKTLADDETQRDLNQVLAWVEDVIAVMEKLKQAGENNDLPYTQRLRMLQDGSQGDAN